MAKVKVNVPEGMKCYKKQGGGNFRFQNRIIKQGQNFWAFPEAIPDAFKDTVQEIAADPKAVIVKDGAALPKAKVVPAKSDTDEPKFKMVKVKGEDKKPIKVKGKLVYNIVSIADDKVMNGEPLGKAKATELLNSLSE